MCNSTGNVPDSYCNSLDNSILPWFANIFDRKPRYVVAMTRRCMNILELGYGEKLPDTAVTENGILMLAEEIAAYFEQYEELPAIAVLDDILVHGRTVSGFLQNFYNLIVDCLAERQALYSPAVLQNSFYQKVVLWIYAVNETTILLKQNYQRTMQYSHRWRSIEWRKLSNKVSYQIWNSDIVNTSGLISARAEHLAWEQFHPDAEQWLADERTVYRKAVQKTFLHKLSRRYKVYPTVRIRKSDVALYFVPFFYVGDLNQKQIWQILACILNAPEKKEALMDLVDLLHRAAGFQERYHVYFQLVSLLLNQITLNTYLQDIGLSPSDFSYDTKKIARNFGTVDEIKSIFDRLCLMEWSSSLLEEICRIANLPEKNDLRATKESFGQDFESLFESLEGIIYGQALEQEMAAKEIEPIYENGGEADSDKLRAADGISITDLMDRLFCIENSCRRDLNIELMIISYVTQMMDYGDISVRLHWMLRNEEPVYYSAIHSTEMTLSILPRKLSVYYPALLRMIRFFWRENKLPEYTDRYLNRMRRQYPQIIARYGQYDMVRKTAIQYAKFIVKYRSVRNALMNWDIGFLEDVPQSERMQFREDQKILYDSIFG